MQAAGVHPVAMLVVEAFMEQRIDHGEMVSWAQELDVPPDEVTRAFMSSGDDFFSPLVPRTDGCSRCLRCTQAAIVFAYAHGRIGLGEALDWARELGLDRHAMIRLVGLCAREAHGNGTESCGCAA